MTGLLIVTDSRYRPDPITIVPPAGASASARFRLATGADEDPPLASFPDVDTNTEPAGAGYDIEPKLAAPGPELLTGGAVGGLPARLGPLK